MTMKKSLIKFSLISQFFILVVKFSIAMHPSIFPLPHIGLTINILVNSLTMSHYLSTFIRVSLECLTYVTTHTALFGSRVPETLFCKYLPIAKKRRLLLVDDTYVFTI